MTTGKTLQKLNPEPKRLWLEGLRSERYSQTREAFYREEPGVIMDGEDETDHQAGHCCLAVFTDVAIRAGVPGVRAIRNGDGVVERYEQLHAWNDETLEWEPLEPDDVETVLAERKEWTAEVDNEDGDPQEEDKGPWYQWQVCGDDLPAVVSWWAGLDGVTDPVLAEHDEGVLTAVHANDEDKFSFLAIAELVEKNL